MGERLGRPDVDDGVDCLDGRSSGHGVLEFLMRVSVTGHVRVAAVSYTHLRAHETVLDLVCRLLLEKKKNNNQISVS